MTARIASEMATIQRSPRRANPIAATMTRLIGVAMTARIPSHRNASGASDPRSARMLPEIERRPAGQRRDPGGKHQDDADGQQPDRDVGDRDEQPADEPVELATAPGVRTRYARHETARSSIWIAV